MLAGILIGGRATRMNGLAKGMMLAPDGRAIVARTRDLFTIEGVRVVLLGKNPAYDSLGIPSIADAEGFSGPLAGLVALMREARARAIDRVFLVGGDMPHLTQGIVHKLVTTKSAAIAPKSNASTTPARDRWEPLFSSFLLSRIQDDFEGARSPSAILDALHADTLTLTTDEDAALADWDTPEDAAPTPEARA